LHAHGSRPHSRQPHGYHLYPVLFDGSDFGVDHDDFMGIIYHEFGVKTAPHYLPRARGRWTVNRHRGKAPSP